ncbi:MAG: DEAD/DEAH box helicase [Archaeoglobaceae archaeon]
MEVNEIAKCLPKTVVDVLKDSGISKLFPPQAEALPYVFSDKNLLICMSTAAGKTLLAELAMIREIFNGGKSLYVAPLKAIVSEKYKSFKKWEKIGIKVGISTGDYSSTDDYLADCDLIIATCEKADSLLRNKARWMSKIGCLVVDELHLIDDVERGVNLEVFITKMLESARIIGLSATVKNYREIAEWLNAECYYSNWRPVPLIEGYYIKNELVMVDGRRLKVKLDDIIKDSGGVLIFEPTRRSAECTAEKLSEMKLANCEDLAKAILMENEGEMSRKLASCIKHGVAFHHAGLLPSQREIVEEAFRKGEIKIVVATPTLAAGVNLPARRVIIKSIYRYDGYSKPIKVMEYKQMAGRAGRPGMDEVGEAIVVTNRKEMAEKYIYGEPEPVISKLASEVKLRSHVLSLICDGFNDRKDIESFLNKTLFRKQNDGPIDFIVEKVLIQLESWKMIKFEKKLIPTELGYLVNRLYIDPLTGYIFYETITQKKLSELGVLHLICRTPDMERLRVLKDDDWVEEDAFELKDELNYYPSVYSIDYDWFLEEVKTTFCLRDWINELNEDQICKKYGIAPGDLRRIVERAEWLCSSAERIAKMLGRNIPKLSTRIKYGVREELLELISLPGIGRMRARKLFNAGIKSISDLIEKRSIAEKLVGKKVVENAIKDFS